jgi:hypothetical protein
MGIATAMAAVAAVLGLVVSSPADIANWNAGGGESILQKITTDLDNAGTAGKNQDIPAMAAACAALQTDAQAARAYKPIPDPDAQAHWAAALADFARAAWRCKLALNPRNPGDLRQAGADASAGVRELQMAAARIKEIENSV